MKKLRGNALLGQSGGPTSVINSSAAGVFLESLKQDSITGIYAAVHGIKGILNEDFYDIGKENKSELLFLKNTPASAIGSVRYKLSNPKNNAGDYKKLLAVFKKYNIRFFFYNGGNDSMDTCNKISKFLRENNYDCNVMGVPKTIDNDLNITDHSPGYGSAAKYVATTFMELFHDATVYDQPMITIVEVMGRNAGWLTAASQLAKMKNQGPDLIYLPEVVFDPENFITDTKKILSEKGKVIIAVSEGIKNHEGKYIPELYQDLTKDAFGHAQLGGTAEVLKKELSKHVNVKIRSIEFSLMQRSAAHLASKVDVEEAFNAGKIAVQKAVMGSSDKMIGFKRLSSNPYSIEYIEIPLHEAANEEQKIPISWIKKDNTGLTQDFIEYSLPLIQGDDKAILEDGLPRFAKLKKIRVEKI